MKDPVVGRCIYDLFIPGSQSLKEKRHPIKSIKDTVRNRFNVSVAEVVKPNCGSEAPLLLPWWRATISRSATLLRRSGALSKAGAI